MDFAGGVTWIPFQSLEQPPDNLSWRDLDRAAYLDTGKGHLHEGFYAFRELTLKLPLLWPLALIFWLPGIQVPGRAVYRWVAANRYRLSSCGVSASKSEQDFTSPSEPRDNR